MDDGKKQFASGILKESFQKLQCVRTRFRQDTNNISGSGSDRMVLLKIEPKYLNNKYAPLIRNQVSERFLLNPN